MIDTIAQLKKVKDDLEKICPSYKTGDFEKAMELVNAVEHIELAKYHLLFAINKLIVYQCFERKDDGGGEVAE